MKTEEWQLEEVELAPEQLEAGVLYYSERLGFLQHLCACGCGIQVHVPTYGPGDNWTIDQESLTVVGSFADRFHCRSHYSIRNGKTVWY